MNGVKKVKQAFSVSFFLAGLFWLVSSFYQQAPNTFVQFRILTITDLATAQQIDSKIASKSGVLESRTDYISSTYFCLLSPDAEYTKDDFVNWFSKMGFEISCYSKGIQGVDVMISPHELKKCVDQKE